MKTIKLDYPGVKILSISNGWGFMLKAVIIIAKDKADKKNRLEEYKKVQSNIQKELIENDWKTIYDRTPKVYILTESTFKRNWRYLR